LVSLAALAWMLLKFSSKSASTLFDKGMTFQLVSDRVDGVSEGSPIFYLGVNVGRVTAVRRQPNNRQVVVDAMADTPYPLPRNVIGLIRQQSPLSASAAISLEPQGQPSAEPLTNGTQVPARFQGGGVVPPEFGVLATEISQRQVILHLDETIVSINTLLKHFNELAGDPAVRQDIRETLARLKEASENIQKVSGRFDELAGEAKTTMAQVRTTVGDTGQRVDQVSKELNGRLQQVGDVLARFESISTKMDKGQGTAGQLVNDPRLYESLVDTSRDLNETIRTLKRVADQWENEGLKLNLR
jgi:phospholipid/cholesterol/gamma-HCH transport system substrate-binding protein